MTRSTGSSFYESKWDLPDLTLRSQKLFATEESRQHKSEEKAFLRFEIGGRCGETGGKGGFCPQMRQIDTARARTEDFFDSKGSILLFLGKLIPLFEGQGLVYFLIVCVTLPVFGDEPFIFSFVDSGFGLRPLTRSPRALLSLCLIALASLRFCFEAF